jgi:hypothetical protein
MSMLDRFKKNKKDFDRITDDMFAGRDLPGLDEIKHLVKTDIWKYIADTIAYRVKSARDDLEDQNLDLDTIRVQQGRIEELRFIESLPDFLIEQYDNLKAETGASREAKASSVNKKQEA